MVHPVRDDKVGTDRWEEDRDSEPTQVARLARNRARRKPASSSDHPHDILGVRRRASASEIRGAYLRLVKELHPDGRARDMDAHEADERLKAINQAYKKLKGPGGRAGAKGAEGRKWRRRASAIFVVGALTSAMPAFVILAVFYYYNAERLGPPNPAPGPGRIADAVSAFTKDPSAGHQSALAEAQKEGTKEAWARFLAAYPEGEPAEQARRSIAAIERAEARRRESIAWNAAENGTKEDLQRFISAYPDGEHAPRARQAIAAIELALARKLEERAAWHAAEKGTKEDLQRFIAAYPDGEHAPQAGRALAAIAAADARHQADLAAWTIADRAGDRQALSKYLSDFPSGRHAEEAKQRVAGLDAEEGEKDAAAWLKARQRNSKAAYAGYLTSHPLGRRAANARARIAELEQIEAEAKQANAQASKRARIARSAKSRPPPFPKRGQVAGGGWPTKAGQAAGGGWPTADEPFVGPDGRIRR
jgi:curved DNA-binding protein CbpA